MIVQCMYFCDYRVVTRFISHSLSPCIYHLHLQLPVYHPLGIALRSRCLLLHGGVSNNRWNCPCGFLVTYTSSSLQSLHNDIHSTNKHKLATTSCFIFLLKKQKQYIFSWLSIQASGTIAVSIQVKTGWWFVVLLWHSIVLKTTLSEMYIKYTWLKIHLKYHCFTDLSQ